ncbi:MULTISPECIES: MerR family transcriptional regulator [Stutzerimonas stutzeri subgroup]|jgi:DNA-binding transcriptional MerR regulator|uniref:MerR family transcriptional regulator n=1 Tax=Stutzerimonas stutzeri NF13 TaxID=1212548 RepID=M2TPP3_STUST|nr:MULTISPECIES: MerR family transcriptional regulator [Stutzerimonas stutzeri subgroup]MBS66793.1 MerR family transcriptional regulator [Pseudomonas sp.]WOF80572.1 MerR family transcriptional regulator [Pseudomonas sp. FeN3W]EMD99255.1 MerR family transcriptional regulator [Stutzerimonas stutzeri NF13]MBK3881942.1 MerR family transcriptional regulator [Stutzerimonas stutzeri]MCQ4289752.1 MerR family transcriptional regulator [Stutzerimonas stutzeri]|tara:strand:- start:4534 stop:4911 length:378 start_codon:yes stop_codon:yes gene_type:complete
MSEAPVRLSIRQFAARTGLSADTLRYYEKIGLLRQVARDASGFRVYGPRDLEWIGFILRLKDTGMALDDIIRYADLREHGDATLAARQALLEAHAARLQKRIQRDREHLDALQAKIALYRQQTSA